MKLLYSDTFEFPLPGGHRFPMRRYRLLRQKLQSGLHSVGAEFVLPNAATDDQLRLVHTTEYLDKLTRGKLTPLEERRIGFPWSPPMVERSRRSTGATIDAARASLVDGVGVHLAGGTHHAFPDHGQGFCVFNDVAVAIRTLQREGSIKRALVIDLDVHQGNGTAFVFAKDPSVFTFSVHGERNYPFRKVEGDLDIALPDGTADARYLEILRGAINETLPLHNVDIVFYLAGADPYRFDRLGKLALTMQGLAARDEMVAEACQRHGVPLAVVMAGGYARSIDDVVTINVNTIRTVPSAVRSRRSRAAQP